MDHQVFVYKIRQEAAPIVNVPCHPEKAYPEYPFDALSEENLIYDSIRDMFIRIGYDKENVGRPSWNPLVDFIRPGQHVLIKPNLVFHQSHKKGEDYYSVVTHPAIIRCLVDYVYLALQGRGRITIGDAPLNNARFDVLCQNLGLIELKSMYTARGFAIDLVDFRLYTMDKDDHGVISDQRLITTMENHAVVDLGNESMLKEYDDHFKRYRVTEYDGKSMPLYHNTDTHRYCFHKSVLDADVIISLPKIKTHRKAGFTCAMKNYVGLNGNKDWLPHHRKGGKLRHGDEYLYPSLRKAIISWSWDQRWKLRSRRLQKILLNLEWQVFRTQKVIPFRDNYWEGSWYGNSTISRTVNDLNRAVLYCDKNGNFQDVPQRKLLYLVDGIICGEGEGPMAATPKVCNLLVWGENAYAVDMLVARLMGFDPDKIDTLRACTSTVRYPLFSKSRSKIEIRSNITDEIHSLDSIRRTIGYRFVPTLGWQGHIELEEI